MPRVLTNDFSWSKSRHEKLSECLRAYYFHYYRSWGGWDRAAPAEARELYTLKKLGNRFTWAIDMPGGMKQRYAIVVEGDRWVETGERSRDGAAWEPFFHMELSRIK